MDALIPRVRALALSVLAAALLAGCQDAPDGLPRSPPTPPMARVTPPPAYPETLACAEIGGQVVLMLQIGVDGKPTAVQIQRSSRHAELDAAAVEGVRSWEFKPATAGGKPVTSKIQVPVTFAPPQVKPDRCFALEEQQRRDAQR